MERESSLKIGLKSLLVSAGIILVLMVISGILTVVLPSGEFDRVVEQGRTLVVPGSFEAMEKPDYPVWRWFTAPFEIFFFEGNIALITIILFIIFVSGAITILEVAGVMEDLIRRLVARFQKNKYTLISVLIFLFMAVASFMGIYEGMVPMIIFIVPLSLSLGWDSLTGLGMSLLPMAFGFAAAVTNPFTIAVAQKIADLPLFSGVWLRIIFFIVVYGICLWFVRRHARRVEADPTSSPSFTKDQELRARLGITLAGVSSGASPLGQAGAGGGDASIPGSPTPSGQGDVPLGGVTASPAADTGIAGAGSAPNPARDGINALPVTEAGMDGAGAVEGSAARGHARALNWFASCVGLAVLLVLVSGQIPALSDLAFPVMGLLFLVGGIGGGLFAGMGPGRMVGVFFRGVVNMLPGVLLIMMAYSVKHIIVEGMIMDTILHMAVQTISRTPALASAFLIYLVTLGMNFFIGSASAKAFLMMPILVPLAELVGITRQTAVLAFDFGDGFSNMLFPTNALLLIALGFTVVSYPMWLRWTLKLQGIMLLVTSLFLAAAVVIGFGPF
ncbi:YfcC family protein [Spirochaeta lutea]|uniref:C4-dicarboxylate ABC transporter n=1 Tax=Spirochaeta lutea TaxID=1480694 RepID=A0A098QXG9_9SPIO|nr:Na+/H+ antiporter NhaC family protein [Spirochaeta lutea]KGE71177.1 hypothetical protein DC28_11945 [Spirochaeta lutea]